jgi:hypothetical protein
MLKNAKSAQLHYSLYVSTSLLMPMNTFELMVLIERLLWTIIHYQTPAQVTCAHCQRSSGQASAPFPFTQTP